MTAGLPDGRPEQLTMWRYRSVLGLGDGDIRYPVPVGGTPLLPAPRLGAARELSGLWVKDETRGPTTSNKDRATALVIEHGLRAGATTVTTSSTGNAAVSTAYGAAAAGLRAAIFVSADCDPAKVAQMTLAGAWVFRVAQGYAAAVDLSVAAAREFGWLDRNTGVNPLTMLAKMTVALEVWEQLGRQAPDVMIAPVGDGPTLAALHQGFGELSARGAIDRMPRLVGVQAASCQPLVRQWAGRPARADELAPDRTVADGIAVLRPAIGDRVLAAVRDSGGGMVAVSDAGLLAAVAELARSAGIGAEPAGAAALAGLDAALGQGLVRRSERIVLLVTGRGKGAAPAGPDGARVVDISHPDTDWDLTAALGRVREVMS